MSRAAAEPYPLDSESKAQLNFAYDLLALLFEAAPLVTVLEDDRGVFLHFPNGREREIVAMLRDTDWEPTLRLVQEHIDA